MQILEERIVEQYRVHRYIGAGPLGYLYAVSAEEGSHASLALKILRDELVTSDHDRRVLKLAHEHVKDIASHRRFLPILGVWAKNSRTHVLNALDTGQSLESLLCRTQAQGMQFLARDVITLLEALVEAVEALHQTGMPHGDLKPSNVRALNSEAGQGLYLRDVALSDYIYAHLTTMRQCMRRQTDAALYAAPEQFDSTVLLASDQYALAALMFRCLTGKTPFFPRSIESIIVQKRDTESLQARAPDLHPAVLGVLQRAMDARPDARYPSVRQFSQAFSSAVAQHEPELFLATVHAGGPPRIRRREMLLGVAATAAGFMVTGLLRVPFTKVDLAAGGSSGNAALPAATTAYERTWITQAHAQATTSLAWSPSGTRLLTGGTDGKVRVWAPTDSQQALMTIPATGPVNAVAWSPAADLVVFGDDAGLVTVANPLNGHIVMSKNIGDGAVYSLAWYPDGKRFVAGSASGHVVVWDMTTGNAALLQPGPKAKQSARAVTVSSNGKFIAAGSTNSELYIWDAHTEHWIVSFTQSEGPLYAVAFSPDGQQIAAAGYDTRVRIWSTGAFDVTTAFPAEDTGLVRCMCWSSDGQLLASGSDNGQLVLWNIGSAMHEHTNISIGTPVLDVDWLSDTRKLAIAGGDGTVSLWNPRS